MEYAIKAPQIGEAVQTVTILKFFKAEGEQVQQDELLVTIETDKSAMEVESPISGIVKKILFPEGSVIAVGEVMVLLQEEETASEPKKHSLTIKAEYITVTDPSDIIANTRNITLSPRERAYCLDNKVIPLQLWKKTNERLVKKDNKSDDYYEDIAISKNQINLVKAFSDSAQKVICANVQSLCDNKPIEALRKELRKYATKQLIPSRLELITWSVICALKNHPAFCSRVINASTIRRFKNPNIGIAVSKHNDELTTAVISNIYSHAFFDFVMHFRESLDEAKEDYHVANYHCMAISDLSAFGITNAVPVVTYPASSTLFIGKPFLRDGNKDYFTLSLSFDHRIINGAGAASFLNDVSRSLKTIKAA